ncbi:MAG: hypothetical protein EOP33_07145 [Rickettsiaceae bacterium]|nr:MAG: hypothetical protein EOP33_07145 [Rickettsiaceae bacterium]
MTPPARRVRAGRAGSVAAAPAFGKTAARAAALPAAAPAPARPAAPPAAPPAPARWRPANLRFPPMSCAAPAGRAGPGRARWW